jgi:DNA polymerase I
VPSGRIADVWHALVTDPDGGGVVQAVADDGTRVGAPERVPDVPAAVRGAGPGRRWVWADTAEVYPRLLAAGVRVGRCWDLALVEALLAGYEGRWGEPSSLGAAWARLQGLPVPAAPRHRPADQAALFEVDRSGLPPGTDPLDALLAVHAGQVRRLARTATPDRLQLLAAAESAGALAAAEMSAAGLPWRVDVHDRLLAELLGPRPGPGMPPARLGDLAERIRAAFGGRQVNPDSPAEVQRAFAAAGIALPSTRSWVLQGVDHPAARLLVEYRELSRVHAAHGWAWQASWVRGGRFRPQYVPGGVVSGRWATRGGGALQIPRAVRAAVVADAGRVLVTADAAQLEPRVLAALSGDRRLARAAGTGDLYATVAADAFDRDRGRAKVAVLAAMYGQTTGEAGQLLGTLRRRFPEAVGYVEAAARDGEQGRLVRSRLGRTCPPPPAGWDELLAGAAEEASRTGPEAAGQDRGSPAGAAAAGRRIRSRGRFTRNFVVQASAADWALVLLASLRRRLAALSPAGAPGPAGAGGTGGPAGRPELVFFQHDEVIVDAPEELADDVRAAVAAAADEARTLVFPGTPVVFPLGVAAVRCYADAK